MIEMGHRPHMTRLAKSSLMRSGQINQKQKEDIQMGKLTVSPEDVKKSREFGKIVKPGWYRSTVKEAYDKLSNAGDSTNHWIHFIVEQEGDVKGREFRRCFSEKAPGFAVPFYEACGFKVADTGGEIVFDKTVGKKIGIYIGNELNKDNGKMQNTVQDFRPEV